MEPIFISEWEYNSTQECTGHTYQVWQCKHRDGHTAFAITYQGKSKTENKPTGKLSQYFYWHRKRK